MIAALSGSKRVEQAPQADGLAAKLGIRQFRSP